MMAQKHLHELLKEDQEPFHLRSYVADRRCQLKTPSPRTTVQARKRKPIINSSSTGRSLCRQACFFSFNDSPDVLKSPLPDFLSPASKSPCKSPNGTVFLHVPARTASLLLEAAMRIQKQSSEKTKDKVRNARFGLFGSILKRLKDRNKTRKRELCSNGDNDSQPDSYVLSGNIPRKCEKVNEKLLGVEDKSAYEIMRVSSCTCNNSRLSNAWWSESNEEKSLDMETSSSCRSEDSEEVEFAAEVKQNGASLSRDKHLCSSPFRFARPKSPSSLCTPDFLSPAASPICHKKENKENYEAESLRAVQLEKNEEEQCSPISVLDPPFEDDDNGDEHEEEDRDDSSYAILQRAKEELLHKLHRFEKLAELDPVELEKTMWEEQCDEGEDDFQELEDEGAMSPYRENNVDEFIGELFCQSSLNHLRKTPVGMRRLVSDLIAEEMREYNALDDGEMVSKRVHKRLHSWKEVETNTIDMIVELDFRREFKEWKECQEQVAEMAEEIELAVFELLVEEFSEELVYLAGL